MVYNWRRTHIFIVIQPIWKRSMNISFDLVRSVIIKLLPLCSLALAKLTYLNYATIQLSNTTHSTRGVSQPHPAAEDTRQCKLFARTLKKGQQLLPSSPSGPDMFRLEAGETKATRELLTGDYGDTSCYLVPPEMVICASTLAGYDTTPRHDTHRFLVKALLNSLHLSRVVE